MGLEDGGGGWGAHCLATRHCGYLLQCHFGHEEVGAAGLLKRLSVLILIFLILATDGSCGLPGWIVGVIVFVAVLVGCFCSFVVFCCARHVRRRKRGLLDDC